MRLSQILDAVLAAVVAPTCAVCLRVLDRPLSGAICDCCFAAVDVRPVATSRSPSISASAEIGPYDGILREIVHALKYDGRRSAAPRLSHMMAAAGVSVLDGADLVVSVPLHRSRLRQRGFNQAEDLARGLGLPVAAVLRRVRRTRAQVELPAIERQSNVAGAFVLASRRATRQVTGRTVVLIDDVATTGATLEACARVLRSAGAREVRALTAARVATPLPPSPLR